MIRPLAVICCSMLSIPQVAFSQERAPNGQIYGELRPFVGLEGVTVQVLGLRGNVYNIRGASPDPAKDATGLSSGELEQLDRAIRDDIVIAFREQGVPLLDGSQSPDTTPRLGVRIGWMNIKQGMIVIDVTTRLREGARLIKDPSTIVWAETWGSGLAGYPSTSPESLAKDVRHVALGGVNEFLRLYVRAHAR